MQYWLAKSLEKFPSVSQSQNRILPDIKHDRYHVLNKSLKIIQSNWPFPL